VREWLERLELQASPEQTQAILAEVKEASIAKKGLLDPQEFTRIVGSVLGGAPSAALAGVVS
jgi:hypothetical protein